MEQVVMRQRTVFFRIQAPAVDTRSGLGTLRHPRLVALWSGIPAMK
jgi:hypothetical protein